ncbi:glycosyltransferase [Flavobacterium sp. AC]|uniref:Glycosyltransferase n=1 Tax=Flavobacterium azizsancarii TaxID=2961580 RepID=A0ABT4W9J3_9FLAO|nr:glycosyltransferase family 2 protein [Flavobacterium azizsancarii]MDA6068800.1 glycosyltransferase [Flavobacterium azizsancarii]
MDLKNKPLISIITVCYNAVNTIEQTILSVINQGYEDYEYIIIDGVSTDGTIDIIKKYEDKISYWVSEPDKGIYDAMNKGISKASGVLIGMINADDWYENNAIEKIANKYLEYPDIGVFHGLIRYVNSDNVISAVIGFNSITLGEKMIQHPTCFVNKSIYDLYGTYSLAYKYASDYEFMLKIYENSVKFYFIDEIIANFREGGVSYSIQGQKEDYLIKYKYNKISYYRYFILSSYLNIKKIISYKFN